MIDEQTVLDQGGLPTPSGVLDQQDFSIYWKECLSCGNVKPFGKFRRDSSFREGVRDRCLDCESAPRLSTEEHISRLNENNYYDERVKRQRWDNQLDYMDVDARMVKYLHHSDVLSRLRKVISTDKLFVTDGRIVGDISFYRVYGQPQPDGKDWKYLFYMPLGYMPAYSVYEFDRVRDVPIKEHIRGWRTVLLRLIKDGLLTERQADKFFGKAEDAGSIVYRRQLHKFRNR